MTVSAPSTRRLSKCFRLLPVLLAVAGLPAPAAAQTTKVLAAGSGLTDDTTIRGGGYSGVNYSTDSTLGTKKSADISNVRRVLLKFDTSNTIPAGARVSKAVLTLTLQSAGATSSRPIAVRRVTRSFLKGSANWSRYRSSSYWSSAGGDLAETWATTYVGRAAGSAVSFDVTSLVQKAVSGSFGSRYTRMALVDVGAAHNESGRTFHSSRAGTASVRPRLVVTYGSATSLPATTTSGTTLKVMSYNTHHGVGRDGRYDLNRIADVIVGQNVDVVALQEVMFNSGFGNGENQPETYKRLVQQKTGRTWYYVYARMDGNWGSTSWAVGNMLLSRVPFSTTSRHGLSYDRSIAHGKVFVGGRGVHLFSTHLDAASSSYRATQINQLKYYASTFGESRVVLGDFNARPGSSEYSLMVRDYQDAWADGVAAGVGSSPSGSIGYTMGTSRLDYVFESRSVSTLVLTRVAVIDSNASDHRPLVATYKIQ